MTFGPPLLLCTPACAANRDPLTEGSTPTSAYSGQEVCESIGYSSVYLYPRWLRGYSYVSCNTRHQKRALTLEELILAHCHARLRFESIPTVQQRVFYSALNSLRVKVSLSN
jgi:hypothetical protein